MRPIGEFFDANFDMLQPVFPIGSYNRGTMCAGERDIDLMACLRGFGPDNLRDRFRDDSSRFLDWSRNALNERYYRTEVSSKRVCVKRDFTDIVTDVTPCFLNGNNGFFMPNGTGGWMRTNPPFHATFMANADAEKGGKLKPVVRLLKAWNIANGHELNSFHVELMVEAAQRPYDIYSHAFEVGWTLSVLSGMLEHGFNDPWPDGGHIDSYLSWEDRQMVVRMMRDDAARAQAAQEYDKTGRVREAIDRWSLVYRHTFPGC